MSVLKAKMKVSLISVQITNLMILFFLVLFSLLVKNNNFMFNEWAVIVTYLSIALLIYQLLVMSKFLISVFSFKYLFIVFTYIFLFGQVWLVAFGQSAFLFYPLILRYPDSLLYEAGLFSICYVQAIFTGLLSYNKPKRLSRRFFSTVDKMVLSYLMYKSGMILLALSLPFKLYKDIYSLMQVRLQGFYTNIAVPFSPAKDIEILVIPSIILIILSKHRSRKWNTALLGISIAYLLSIMMFSGDRRYHFTGILALVLSYINLYHYRLKTTTMMNIGLFSIIVLNVLTIIRNTRKESLISLSYFFSNSLAELLSLSFITDTFSEFGVTFITVVIAIKLIPATIPFQFGLSYWGAAVTLLPIGWSIRDFLRQVSILGILNSIERVPVGSSLPAELYANFGWLGVIAAVLMGWVLSRVVGSPTSEKEVSFENVKHYSLLYILINYVRASTVEMFRQSLIVSLVPAAVLYFVYSHYIRTISRRTVC